MSFKAFEEVNGDESLDLPIRGKVYKVWPPSAAVGLSLHMKLAAGIAQSAGIELDDATLRDIEIDDENLPAFGRQCLGPAYDEMVADGVSHTQLERAVATAFMAWTVDREAAEIYWNTAGKAIALAEISDQRPTVTPTRTAGAATTPTPRSATGTSSRRSTKRRAGEGTPSRGPSPTTTT